MHMHQFHAKCVVDALSSPIQSNASHSAQLDDCRQLSIRFDHITSTTAITKQTDAQTDWPGRALLKVMVSFCLIVRLWT